MLCETLETRRLYSADINDASTASPKTLEALLAATKPLLSPTGVLHVNGARR